MLYAPNGFWKSIVKAMILYENTNTANLSWRIEKIQLFHKIIWMSDLFSMPHQAPPPPPKHIFTA